MADTLKRSAYVVLLIAMQSAALGRAEVRPAFAAVPSMESVFILTSAKSHSISGLAEHDDMLHRKPLRSAFPGEREHAHFAADLRLAHFM